MMRRFHVFDRPNIRRIFHRESIRRWIDSGLAMLGIALSLEGLHLSSSWAIKLSYVCFATAMLWSLGSWLTSDTIVKGNPSTWGKQKRKRAKGNVWLRYRTRKYSVVLGICMIFLVPIVATYKINDKMELLRTDGWLIPSNEPSPVSRCDGQIPKGAVAVYMGQSVAWFTRSGFFTPPDTENYPVIAAPKLDTPETGNLLLGISKNGSGRISITTDLRDREMKILAQIEYNEFHVNPHTARMTLSDDRSTLTVTDDYGKTLEVRYLNPTAVKVTGRLYYAPDSYLEIGDRETIQVTGNARDKRNTFDGCWQEAQDQMGASIIVDAGRLAF